MADQFVIYPPTTSISSIAQLPAALGQTTMANSLAVVIASNQSAIPVSQSGAWTVAATQSGTWNITNISGTISLPTGAATEATLAAASAKLPATLGQKLMAASMAVTLASDQSALAVTGTFFQATQPVSGTVAATQSGTWNITNISGTISLPTGAATETTLAAMSAKLPAALGQTTMAASMSVAIASNQSTLPVNIQGLVSADLARIDYTGTNVTTGAYVQLIASTAAAAKGLFIFDSSGQTLFLAFGAGGAEVNKIYVVPGGNGWVDLAIPASTRLSLKAVSATASTGEINVSLLG